MEFLRRRKVRIPRLLRAARLLPSPDVMPEVPIGRPCYRRRGWNQQWLADTNADWQLGLDLAERSANLLEAAQLIAMHELPTRQRGFVGKGQPDMPALRSLVQKFTTILEPYQLPEGDPLPAGLPVG